MKDTFAESLLQSLASPQIGTHTWDDIAPTKILLGSGKCLAERNALRDVAIDRCPARCRDLQYGDGNNVRFKREHREVGTMAHFYLIVSIDKRQILPTCLVNATVACSSKPTIALPHHSHLLVLLSQSQGKRRSLVGRTVIDNDHLISSTARRHGPHYTADASCQRKLRIESRNNEGYEQ